MPMGTGRRRHLRSLVEADQRVGECLADEMLLLDDVGQAAEGRRERRGLALEPDLQIHHVDTGPGDDAGGEAQLRGGGAGPVGAFRQAIQLLRRQLRRRRPPPHQRAEAAQHRVERRERRDQ